MIVHVIPENAIETDAAAYPYPAAERMESAMKAMLIIFVDQWLARENYGSIYEDGPIFILLGMNRLIRKVQSSLRPASRIHRSQSVGINANTASCASQQPDFWVNV